MQLRNQQTRGIRRPRRAPFVSQLADLSRNLSLATISLSLRKSACSEPGRRTCACRDPVLASGTCPVCRMGPIHARQKVCSGRCRAARSRQRKAEARRRRDAEIRALLEAPLEKLKGSP